MAHVVGLPLPAFPWVVAPLALAGAIMLMPANGVRAGDITANRPRLAISQTAPLFSIANAAPGMHEARRVTLTNRGTAAARLRLTVSTIGSTRLARRLRVRITMRDQVVYRGSLASRKTIRLGRIAPKARRRFRIGIRFPRAATNQNRLQGSHVQIRLDWTATAR
jgi:hypothetical protein